MIKALRLLCTLTLSFTFISISFTGTASARSYLWTEGDGFKIYRFNSSCQYGGPVKLQLQMKKKKFIPTAQEMDDRGVTEAIAIKMAAKCPGDRAAKIHIRDKKGRVVAAHTLYKDLDWKAAAAPNEVMTKIWPLWKEETPKSGLFPDPITIGEVSTLNSQINDLLSMRPDTSSGMSFMRTVAPPEVKEEVILSLVQKRNTIIAEQIDSVGARLETLPFNYAGFETIEKTIKSAEELRNIIGVKRYLSMKKSEEFYTLLNYTDAITKLANDQAALRSDAASTELSRQSLLARSRGKIDEYEDRMKSVLGDNYQSATVAKTIEDDRTLDRKLRNQDQSKADYFTQFAGVIRPPEDGNYQPPYLNAFEQTLLKQHEQAQLNSVAVAAELGPEVCSTRSSQTFVNGWAGGSVSKNTTCSPDISRGKDIQREQNATNAPTSQDIFNVCSKQLKTEFCQCLSDRNANHFTAEEFGLFTQSPKTYAYYIQDRGFSNPMSIGANSLGSMFTGIAALTQGNAEASVDAFRTMALQRPSNGGDLFTSCAITHN